jgi:hypothetical protein
MNHLLHIYYILKISSQPLVARRINKSKLYNHGKYKTLRVEIDFLTYHREDEKIYQGKYSAASFMVQHLTRFQKRNKVN